MDAEERPQKMRKLSHGGEAPLEDNMAAAIVNTTMDANSTEPTAPAIQSENLDHGNTSSEDENDSGAEAVQSTDAGKPLSKNQLKKMRRDAEWEAGRESRKVKRKQKIRERKERKRAARILEAEQNAANSTEGAENSPSTPQPPPKSKLPARFTLLPITLLLDCQFNDLMTSNEIISLGSQITRAYSDNHRAPFKAHLAISSWSGVLKERFDTILTKQYEKWKGVRFLSEDYMEVAQKAKEWMAGPNGGSLEGAFASLPAKPAVETGDSETVNGKPDESTKKLGPLGEPGEIVYLTSDSPYTLTHLSPYSTYIIGGIVDKNRHKGLCYNLAREAGADTEGSPLRTAKLPIGEYLSMRSRTVLATNHVSEIMVRWLECGDWGEAFSRVMPKRKGATLKERDDGKTEKNNDDDFEEENDDGNEDENMAVDEAVGDEPKKVEDQATSTATEPAQENGS